MDLVISRIFLAAAALCSLLLTATLAQGQDPNFFTLEIESESQTDVEPQDLITVDPIQLSVQRFLLSGIKPDLKDPKLVHSDTFGDGAIIQQGTLLLFDVRYYAPSDIDIKRRLWLYSSLDNPRHELAEDTEFELGGADHLEIKWRPFDQSPQYKSVAVINDHIQKARRPSDAKPKQSGQSQFFRDVFLETANLKPGDYKLRAKVYRKEGEETVEADRQNFDFTIVAAPIHVATFIPNTVKTYNGSSSAFPDEYEAAMSDWAVPPYSVYLKASHPGFTLWYDGETTQEGLSENVFAIIARPKPNLAGRKVSLKLTVKDGLGRVGKLSREISIDDGSDFEIKVSMPSVVKAGQTLTGTVKYPAGFILKKPPKIGDTRGFEWANSDYTSFRISPQEEGVDHKRLFAIIAPGTMAGMDEDPVLVWKREYTVKSQNLIYDEARNKRRTDANNRAWREALGALAAGVGEAAATYENAQSSQNSGSTHMESSDDSIYEIINTETFGNDSVDSIYESVDQNSGLDQSSNAYSGSSTSYSQNAASGNTAQSSRPSAAALNGLSGELDFSNGEPKHICGIQNAADDWNVSWDHSSYYGAFFIKDDHGNLGDVEIIQLTGKKDVSGTTERPVMEFYAKNCVLKYEYAPRLDEHTIIENWDNGGRKRIYNSDGYTKEWDRAGNVTKYWPNDGAGKNRCSNSDRDIKRCS